jgi:hypothetical protein
MYAVHHSLCRGLPILLEVFRTGKREDQGPAPLNQVHDVSVFQYRVLIAFFTPIAVDAGIEFKKYKLLCVA